jgi:hypothetical protein
MILFSTLKAYLDSPLDETILGRAVLNENRLGRIIREIWSGIYWIFTRGGTLALGVLAGWILYSASEGIGRQNGFNEGCRAAAGPAAEMCSVAENAAMHIRSLLKNPDHPLPGGVLLTALQKDTIAPLCSDLLNSVPKDVALHYAPECQQ